MSHLRHRLRFFISQESYVLFSRYSSLCTFHHLVIYPVWYVMMSINSCYGWKWLFLLKNVTFFKFSLKSSPPRHWNTGFMSSSTSLTSWGEGASLALVDHPSIDDVTIKMPYKVDVLCWPASHPIFFYWVG